VLNRVMEIKFIVTMFFLIRESPLFSTLSLAIANLLGPESDLKVRGF